MRLASEAVLDALDDAGLTPADVDGMVTFTMDSNTEVAIARATGIGELKFFSKIHHGGGAACATIQQAAIAVATGVADCVVAYRAFNERSGMRFGQVQMRLVENADSTGVDNSFSYPHGLSTPAAQVAMIAKRYMHLLRRDEQGLRRDLGGRPQARGQEPEGVLLREADHHRGSPEFAVDRRAAAVAGLLPGDRRRRRARGHVGGAGRGSQAPAGDHRGGSRRDPAPISTRWSATTGRSSGLPEMGLVGKQLWSQSGLKPTDIQTAILYDHFTPFTLIQLEELGFCGWGEAKDYIADGAIEIGGRLPINTHGGQLGEAYIHGMNGIAEGVRQLRGTSVNQVPDVEHVLVTAGTGVPTSGLILGQASSL